MATTDIAKLAVFDQRIVQSGAKYAVDKGALSLTNAPFKAIGASASQLTFNINVPSQNVFVDRAVDYTTNVYMQMNVAVDNTISPWTAGQPVVVFGRDCALAAFPLHELIATMTATINDTSVVINTDTTLHEVLRLCDYKKNRLIRTCPTMLDKYGNYDDSYLAINSPLNSYLDATESAEVPNGAWWNIQFTNATGAVLGPTGAYTDGFGNSISYVAGVPVRTNPVPGPEPAQYGIYFVFNTTEKLVLSPFIFAAAHEWETGLFGINNIQIVMNMKAVVSRVLRSTTQGGRTITAIGFNTTSNKGVFEAATLNVQFLTPSLDIPLPPKSIVSYMEFPRYVNTNYSAIPAKSLQNIQSQTIVLPQIPDFLVIYAKPSVYAATDADYYMPITKISLNFDNFAGLLSSHTAEQLYSMAVHNGLCMDFDEWRGLARSARTGGLIQSVGGFLVLKPGQDFALQSGQAPGLIGNFTLQFNVDVNNTSAAEQTPVLYVITANSGFFESLGGSSRVIKGVLSEADIISAEPVEGMSRESLKRMVGAGFFDRLGSFLSKAKDIYSSTKPIVSGIKGMLPEAGMLGKVKSGLSAVGYGQAGAGLAGAGYAGAGKKSKSLSARLM
jgi:hypothetical protein